MLENQHVPRPAPFPATGLYTAPHLIHVFPTLLNPSAWDRANLRLFPCPIGSVVTYRIAEHMLALNYLHTFILSLTCTNTVPREDDTVIGVIRQYSHPPGGHTLPYRPAHTLECRVPGVKLEEIVARDKKTG